MGNPYSTLPATNFWRRSVSNVERSCVDPITTTKFQISATDRVMTAGSCFAQHISKTLSTFGFNYMVTEDDNTLGDSERRRRQFGVYTARYGNIYTARQLLQLFNECYSDLHPAEQAWQRRDGRWVDTLRPNIEPDGFADAGEVQAARRAHLDCVRLAFESCDVFVFTLGLTESWQSREDGAVFPLAPGVPGGDFDPARHQFINCDTLSVISDLNEFLGRFKTLNSRVRVVLTVSPVPLIATFENQHVLSATTYSKSVLRVAAEEATRANNWVEYFPSYEIITGNYSRAIYYEDDMREVNSLGVAHAMRCFRRHYMNDMQVATEPDDNPPAPHTRAWSSDVGSDIVCDEEEIERSLTK